MKRFFAGLHRITTVTDASLARSGAASVQANCDLDPLALLALRGPQPLDVLLESTHQSGTTTDRLRRLEMLGMIRNANGGRMTQPGAHVELTDIGRTAVQAAVEAISNGFRDARSFLVDAVESFGPSEPAPSGTDRGMEELALIRDFCRVGPEILSGTPPTPFDRAYSSTIVAAMCMADDNPGLTMTTLADFCGFAVQRIEVVIAWLQQEGLVELQGMTGSLTESGRKMLRDYFETKREVLPQAVSLLRKVLQLQAA